VSDKREEERDEEAFELGTLYEEVGPDLGRLYEARHVATGKPALTLLPGERMEWASEHDWEIGVVYRCKTGKVSLRMDQVPAAPKGPDLANIFVLSDAAVRRIEDNPRLAEHLASGPRPRPWRTWRLPSLMALVLSAGIGCLWLREVPRPSAEVPFEHPAPLLTDSEPSVPGTVAYPLPDKPFSDQAKAPCKPKLDEVEINGGCWLAMKRTPPCLDVQAESQGACYLPVSKHRGHPPPSAQP
jgi:hypothetical protein